LSKKKKTFLIALTTLLFFGALMFSLRQPLSETRANTAAQNKLAADKTGASDKPKLDKQKTGEQEPEVATTETETSETEVKLDAKSDGNSSSTSNGSTSSGGSTSSSGSTSGSGGSSGGSTSGGGSGDGTTPAKPAETKPAPPAPAPTPTKYVVSNPGVFYEVEGSAVPGNKDYAEFSIRMNSSSNYAAQLQELRAVILPVLGESITNQIIEIAKTKTDVTVQFYRCFETDAKKVCISSSGNNPLVSFQSWQK